MFLLLIRNSPPLGSLVVFCGRKLECWCKNHIITRMDVLFFLPLSFSDSCEIWWTFAYFWWSFLLESAFISCEAHPTNAISLFSSYVLLNNWGRVFLFEEQNKSLVCYPKKKYNMENIETWWCKIVPLFNHYENISSNEYEVWT